MPRAKKIDFNAVLDEMFGEGTTFGEYRAGQHVLAKRIWRHAHYRYPKSPYAPVMLQEGGAGLGKTRVELAVAKLLALEGDQDGHPTRSVIAVNTISLREQIGAESETVDRMLEAAFRTLGYARPRRVTVRSLASATQYFSPSRMDAFNTWTKRASISDRDIAAWQEFHSFYEAAMLRALKDTGQEPVQFHDWYAEVGGKPIPLQLSTLDICLCEDDAALFAHVENEQEASYDSDILLCTHSALNILTWRLRYYDSLEKNALDKGDDPKIYKKDYGEYEFLIVDESHGLPDVTRSGLEQSILFSTIGAILGEAPESIYVTNLHKTFNALVEHVHAVVGDQSSARIDASDAYHKFIKPVVEPFYRALRDIYDVHGDSPEYMFIIRIEMMLTAFEPIMRQFHRAGTSDADNREISDADAYPVLIRSGTSYGIHFEAGRLGRKIASIWRRNADALNKRLFKSVVMMSGTLMNATPEERDPYRYFRYEIGATRTSDGVAGSRDVVWSGWSIPSVDVGGATGVIFAERSVDILPSLKYEVNGVYTNPLHTEYLVGMISQAFDMTQSKDNRILVLFMSENALTAAYELLRERDTKRVAVGLPPIAEHVIAQHSGMHFIGAPLTAFQNDQRGVLFSMNWQGINVVDKDRKSIVDHLVISKFPFTPQRERLLYETHARVAIKATFEQAHWLFRQGIGRASRDKDARFVLWICDPRMPLPDELVRFGYAKYTRQSDDFLKGLYKSFDDLVSQRLYGQYGKSSLFAESVSMGYLTIDQKLSVHKVRLSPRPEDRIKIMA